MKRQKAKAGFVARFVRNWRQAFRDLKAMVWQVLAAIGLAWVGWQVVVWLSGGGL